MERHAEGNLNVKDPENKGKHSRVALATEIHNIKVTNAFRKSNIAYYNMQESSAGIIESIESSGNNIRYDLANRVFDMLFTSQIEPRFSGAVTMGIAHAIADAVEIDNGDKIIPPDRNLPSFASIKAMEDYLENSLMPTGKVLKIVDKNNPDKPAQFAVISTNTNTKKAKGKVGYLIFNP